MKAIEKNKPISVIKSFALCFQLKFKAQQQTNKSKTR